MQNLSLSLVDCSVAENQSRVVNFLDEILEQERSFPAKALLYNDDARFILLNHQDEVCGLLIMSPFERNGEEYERICSVLNKPKESLYELHIFFASQMLAILPSLFVPPSRDAVENYPGVKGSLSFFEELLQNISPGDGTILVEDNERTSFFLKFLAKAASHLRLPQGLELEIHYSPNGHCLSGYNVLVFNQTA